MSLRRRCRDCIHAKVVSDPKVGRAVACSMRMFPSGVRRVPLETINQHIDAPVFPGTSRPFAMDCPMFRPSGDDDP